MGRRSMEREDDPVGNEKQMNDLADAPRIDASYVLRNWPAGS